MNIRIKSRNGDVAPKWEQDDANDKLDQDTPVDDIPTLPPMKPDPKPTPKTTVNVVELIETILAAYTEPGVHMWVEGSELIFEQIVQNKDGMFKNTFRIKISAYTTHSVKLIK